MSVADDLRRAFALIRQLQGALGGKSLDGGSNTVSFPGGSPNSTQKTISHTLGRIPSSVVLTPESTSTPIAMYWVAGTFTTTGFDVIGKTTAGGNASGTVNFMWEARG